MAEQHHKADADHDVAEEGGVIGVQAIDMDKVAVQVENSDTSPTAQKVFSVKAAPIRRTESQ